MLLFDGSQIANVHNTALLTVRVVVLPHYSPVTHQGTFCPFIHVLLAHHEGVM